MGLVEADMKDLLNKIHHADCLSFMKQLPDKCVDLILTDPPYRDESENQPTKDMRSNGSMRNFGGKLNKAQLNEMLRISKNQIIWGANNFELPPYKGFLVWKKLTISEGFTMSMAEIAYLSEGLGTVSKIYEFHPQNPEKIHPTQKPLNLFKWCLAHSKLETGIVLDCFSGSGTTALACHDLGLDFICIEKDADYHAASVERLEQHKRQLRLL